MANDLVLRVSLPDEPTNSIGSGGTISYFEDYVIHSITSSQNFVYSGIETIQAEVLLVGGGGIGTMLIKYQGQAMWPEVGTIIVVIAAVVWIMDQASAYIREALK